MLGSLHKEILLSVSFTVADLDGAPFQVCPCARWSEPRAAWRVPGPPSRRVPFATLIPPQTVGRDPGVLTQAHTSLKWQSQLMGWGSGQVCHLCLTHVA